jgi:hypothetical protein
MVLQIVQFNALKIKIMHVKYIFMKNQFLLLILLGLLISKGVAQNEQNPRIFSWDITLGGALTSFQDLKYSEVHWTGVGLSSGMSFVWQRKGIHGAGIESVLASENPKTFEGTGKTKVYQGQIYYYYVYPVKQKENCQLFLGGKIDVVDVNWRIVDGLSNNSSYLIFGSNFKAFSNYQRKLNDKWQLDAQLGFQLFSFMEDGNSFAYAAPQHVLEKGEYNYDEEKLPMFFTPFWDFMSIETSFRFSYGRHWVFNYLWRMQQSYLVKGYRMTYGYSAISVSFKLISKKQE